ncbi:hypothetical protein GUITHDRAFT_158409 [Guillardia theta CCMP2712]|uniref:4-hydroxybenzoate polyprenyltransferase, mitochondrial n=1 Tax=Guillardia theta (strain CCMP2712) TaxID=905079 RepID=L1IUF3_GUITC|nr:hypothetical protein GUITHDRAFT_158409 [Guillardia theta CCMP2712]EKX39470.1 hypothetical protein GUITHDRAFT_158409 [Guillardia theta CCMP2712]|eukprot:XP_005826450.1 hypothetical protein GUITHDRAFT_158409 [Guillardia theta CCMP2712]
MAEERSSRAATGIIRFVPESIQPYFLLARLDKPIGTWLLLWPCCWSIAICAPAGALPDVWMLTKFAIGAVVMRGAGCTINDMWDRNIDKLVERTKMRPLAAGQITQLQALTFLGLQLSAGLCVLVSMNLYSILLGASSLALVVVYPLMKRITFFPQFVLGLAFNWGALLGSSAVLGMYCGSVAWTLMYDTIYAHQDKKDDKLVGVKSTALYFGEQTKPALAAWSSFFVASLLVSGKFAGMGIPYAVGVAGAAVHMAWQIRTVDLDNTMDCMQKFVSNKWVGAIIFSGIVIDKLLA